jgi:hypothetical protein
MALGRWTAVLTGGLLLGLSLRAQQYEAASLGLQLRGSMPLGDLKDAVGGFHTPGLGGSVVMEDDFLEGYRGRVDVGGDNWFKGNLSTVPGTKGGVSAYHLGVEGVRLLRPYGDYPILGPYVLAGLGLYSWSVTTEDTIQHTSTTRKVGHAAASLGCGWRYSAHMDVELKALGGTVDPNFQALAVLLGVTWRY